MIGIFDSGSGGLTVLKAIRDRLPSSDVLYFGDIKNAPYGSKSQEELSSLTIQALKLLQERGATSLVSACNSVSASLALSVLDVFTDTETKIIEMVGPTVSYFRGSSAKILLCATPATIRSGIYQNAFRMIDIEIEAIACGGLAGAIEFGASREELGDIVVKSFAGVRMQDFDVLILACTHYPLVMDIFSGLFPGITVFDPALAVAERVEKRFWPMEAGYGKTTFLLSKETPQFTALVAKLFPGKPYVLEVVE